MSSILKALKKLEQEKTLRREGEIDLSREILHEATRHKVRFSLPWAAAITTIALLLALVGVLLTRRTVTVLPAQPPAQSRETVPPPAPTPAPVSTETILPKPAVPLREEVVLLPQPATAAKPAPFRHPMPQPATATQPATVAKPAPDRIPMPLPPLQQQTAGQGDSRPSLPQTAVPLMAPPLKAEPSKKKNPPVEIAEPAFAVSGIAWSKDSADRLAIVNGQPLSTGSAVGGAVVEEILPDRVRFSQGGRTFEVTLGKAGKTH